MGEPYPVVIALALRGHSAPATIDWKTVRAWENREISLGVAAADLQPHTPVPDEVWLSRDILDKQIVDTDGRRAVRVNDLQLQGSNGSVLLLGVDIGSRGLLRRINAEHVGRRLRRLTGGDLPQRLISWDAVDTLHSDERSVKLRISHTKLSKMHPADIAEIVGQLGGLGRQAVFPRLDDARTPDTPPASAPPGPGHLTPRLPP